MNKPVPVSFKCKLCGAVITLGVIGGRKSLSGPPPCCVYCGHRELEDTDEHLKNGTIIATD